MKVTWFDGGLRPSRPDGLEADKNLDEEGLLFLGDGGTILCGFSGRRPRLIPEAAMKAYKQPAKTLLR